VLGFFFATFFATFLATFALDFAFFLALAAMVSSSGDDLYHCARG
jgi:hypothetical protein